MAFVLLHTHKGTRSPQSRVSDSLAPGCVPRGYRNTHTHSQAELPSHALLSKAWGTGACRLVACPRGVLTRASRWCLLGSRAGPWGRG